MIIHLYEKLVNHLMKISNPNSQLSREIFTRLARSSLRRKDILLHAFRLKYILTSACMITMNFYSHDFIVYSRRTIFDYIIENGC